MLLLKIQIYYDMLVQPLKPSPYTVFFPIHFQTTHQLKHHPHLNSHAQHYFSPLLYIYLPSGISTCTLPHPHYIYKSVLSYSTSFSSSCIPNQVPSKVPDPGTGPFWVPGPEPAPSSVFSQIQTYIPHTTELRPSPKSQSPPKSQPQPGLPCATDT